ncbi:MAG: hypothetical protein SGI74_03745 [Oligoflexia bacterium]|nr:hypothetical protein [Oligoflexia bacterium]
MFEDLVIVHHAKQNKMKDLTFSKAKVSSASWIHWATCLREIQVGINDNSLIISDSAEIFNGEKAYGFFLEVVCGLHSPIIGETEVMGQFKNLIEQTQFPQGPSGHVMRKLFQSILIDAKIIRTEYLKDLGSRTYGSLVRKHLRDTKTLAILGSGQLVQEMLPWLIDANAELNIFCRNQKAGLKLKENYSKLLIRGFNKPAFQKIKADTIVIAAPLENSKIENWFLKNTEMKRVVDLRHNSSQSPLNLGSKTEVIVLHDLYSELSQTDNENSNRVTLARSHIQKLIENRFKKTELRPFGWEDLCG